MVRGSIVVASAVVSASAMKCPGSSAWFGNAKTQVVATAAATCADVQAEMVARASAKNGWTDPHHGGIYTVVSSSATDIETKRTTNPKYAVGGQTYTDKQSFALSNTADGKCQISACSESQTTSIKDFSTNYCDIRNLYCGSADGCKPVAHDFATTQQSVKASSGQSDWSACIVKAKVVALAAESKVEGMKCPGSKAWLGNAKTQVTAVADASCADVKAEITARAQNSGDKMGWTDPHNGGIYSVLAQSTPNFVETQRSTNPKFAVGGQTYTDKQDFTLTEADGKCTIQACSESQGSSLKDFSTNYCDIRNLYCGSKDGCKPVGHDFTTTQTSVKASSGQSDWSACIVKPKETTVIQV